MSCCDNAKASKTEIDVMPRKMGRKGQNDNY